MFNHAEPAMEFSAVSLDVLHTLYMDGLVCVQVT